MKYLEDHYSGEIKVKESPLWYHEQGLMQTATGYGNKLKTTFMVFVDGRWRRVYCRIFSNIGSLYIIWKRQEYLIKYDHTLTGE
jgi:hypothetical protein